LDLLFIRLDLAKRIRSTVPIHNALKESKYADTNVREPSAQPAADRIGFLFVLVAIVGFVLRWLGVVPGLAMAIGLAGLIAADVVLLLISRTYTRNYRIASSNSRCASGARSG
jgi:hypothetical protein